MDSDRLVLKLQLEPTFVTSSMNCRTVPHDPKPREGRKFSLIDHIKLAYHQLRLQYCICKGVNQDEHDRVKV